MAPISAYHRPDSLAEALALLARPGIATVPLAGGTLVNGRPHDGGEVVDLQTLGLDAIERSGLMVTVGAMVRLQDLVDHDALPPLIRELAHREAPSTFRNAATVGGTVAAADPESGLVAGLLVHEAVVTIARDGASTAEVRLSDLLADRTLLSGGLITGVRFAAGGATTFEATARTPADTPIVAVAGRRTESGELLVAATGVAPTPVLVDPDALDTLEPPADFRGSSDYRRELAGVLVGRVVSRLS